MQKLYICMYHYIRDLKHSRYPGIKGLDDGLFERQLQFFSENFNVITMEEAISAIHDQCTLPNNAMLLTFDDGYIDHYLTAFPLLVKYGFQGSFFVPGRVLTEDALLDVNKIHFILASAPIDELVEDLNKFISDNRIRYELQFPNELWDIYAKPTRLDDAKVVFFKRVLQTAIPSELRAKISTVLFEKYVGVKEDCFARELYINKEQMRIMKKNGMFFGIHGYDHNWLGNIPIEESSRDIDMALKVMEEFIDPSCWVMNYPYGNSNQNVISHISAKGCVLGFSTEVKLAELDVDNIYALPRFDCNDFPPQSKRYENE